MIVASLLLILVAVTLLVLGLTGGSSGLLIGSIVASLLAAVALVIGARQAASARRTAADRPAGPEPAMPDPAFAGPDPAFAGPDPAFAGPDPAFAGADSDYAAPGFAAGPGFGAPDDTAEFIAEPEFIAEHAAESAPPSSAAPPPPPPPPPAAEPTRGRSGRRGRRRDSRADDDFVPPAEDFAADSASSAPAWDAADPEVDLDLGDDARDQPFTTQPIDEGAPDYDRASSAISAARSENPEEHAWRREPGPFDGTTDADNRASAAESVGADGRAGEDGRAGAAESVGADDLPGRDAHAEAAAHAGLSVLDDDFAEPDADDPDDEPLPQAVLPTDAVRVARLDAEVLVVDGRPRYHLADCPHLVGRLTEPIPVNEAVELGFSPCGLCRPVDRLVAAAARP